MPQQVKKLHVVFASGEAAPFVKTGGLGDVAGSLPQALAAAGCDVVVMVPKYDTIAAEYTDNMHHAGEFYVPLGWRNEYCGMEVLEHGGVNYVFLDNEHYFHRGYPYGFFDDGERFAFFSKAVCESLQHLGCVQEGFTCDVLHCNDWHTAMAPVFLREFYMESPLYAHVRTVFSIHNIAFQGQFSAKMLNDVLAWPTSPQPPSSSPAGRTPSTSCRARSTTRTPSRRSPPPTPARSKRPSTARAWMASCVAAVASCTVS